MSKLKKFLFGVMLVLGVGCLVMAASCKPMTPAAQAAFDKLEVDAKALADQLPEAYAEYRQIKDEYDTITLQVQAGVPLTVAMTARLKEIAPLLLTAQHRVEKIYASISAILADQNQLKEDGAMWYHRIPWTAIGLALLGAGATYVKTALPAKAALGSALGALGDVVKGVSNYSAAPSSPNEDVKQFILKASRAGGSEAYLDAVVQEVDKPKS